MKPTPQQGVLMDRIVLAFSGGLDTLVAIPWLRNAHGAEIVTVTLDLGQGGELEDIRDRALQAGAARAHVLDVREEFVRDFVVPALQADALHEDRCPMAAALARPLVARKLVEIAAIEGAPAVAHCATGEGGGEDHLELAICALNPALRVLTPARDWGMTRSQAIELARTNGVALPVRIDAVCSVHANLWGRSIMHGVPEASCSEPPEESFTLTRRAADCPDEPAYVEVSFEHGVPTAINGVAMPVGDLIATLSIIAGAHGVGRIDVVESRIAGVKWRKVLEAPAAVVLHAAHRELQELVIARDLDRFSRIVSAQYADIIDGGLWFTPLREALAASAETIQKRVTGGVRLKLFKGDCGIVSRKSPHALDGELAPHESGDAFDHADAVGATRGL
jgi:argininosuccinate synthase